MIRDATASDGWSTHSTALLLVRKSSTAAVFSMCRCIRSAKVSTPCSRWKALVGRQAGAEIAQAFGARPHDEGGGAEFLGEDDAVIAGIGLGHGRKLAGAGQSKRPPSTMTPPMAMPWPPIHLVMECITISAPSSIGRLR